MAASAVHYLPAVVAWHGACTLPGTDFVLSPAVFTFCTQHTSLRDSRLANKTCRYDYISLRNYRGCGLHPQPAILPPQFAVMAAV